RPAGAKRANTRADKSGRHCDWLWKRRIANLPPHDRETSERGEWAQAYSAAQSLRRRAEHGRPRRGIRAARDARGGADQNRAGPAPARVGSGRRLRRNNSAGRSGRLVILSRQNQSRTSGNDAAMLLSGLGMRASDAACARAWRAEPERFRGRGGGKRLRCDRHDATISRTVCRAMCHWNRRESKTMPRTRVARALLRNFDRPLSTPRIDRLRDSIFQRREWLDVAGIPQRRELGLR